MSCLALFLKVCHVKQKYFCLQGSAFGLHQSTLPQCLPGGKAQNVGQNQPPGASGFFSLQQAHPPDKTPPRHQQEGKHSGLLLPVALASLCNSVSVRGPFAKFVDSPYYSESELCGGAVTVSFSKYLPW
jgi:hypothetical protein